MAIKSTFTRVQTPNATFDVQTAVNDIYDKLSHLLSSPNGSSSSTTVPTKTGPSGTGSGVISSGSGTGIGVQNPILPQNLAWLPFSISQIAPRGFMSFLGIQQRCWYIQRQKEVYLRIYLYGGFVTGIIDNQVTLTGGIPILCADGDPQALSCQIIDGNGFMCGGYAVIQNLRGQAVIQCGRADGANFQLGIYLGISITGVYQGV